MIYRGYGNTDEKRRRKEFRGPKQKVIEEKQEKKTCFNRKSDRPISS